MTREFPRLVEANSAQHPLSDPLRLSRELIEAMPNPVYFKDTTGRYLGCNRACEELFGLQRDDYVGKTVADVMPAEIAVLLAQSDADLYRDRKTQSFEIQIPTAQGKLRDVICQKSVFSDEQQNVIGIIGVFTDITKRKVAEDALRANDELFRLITEHVSDLIAIVDTSGRRVYTSPSYRALLGEEVMLLGSDSFEQIHREDRDHVLSVFQQTVETGKGRTVHFRFKLADGSERYIESQGSVILDHAGVPYRVLVVSRDVTDRLTTEQRLRHLAHYDFLTKLPNSALLIDRLQHALDVAQRNNARVAVMFIDLDDFKVVNDTLGHAVGDQLLVAVAERLKDVLRESDTVARQGGDEFIILLENAGTTTEVELIGQMVVDVLCRPYAIGERTLRVGASLGLSVFPDDGQVLEDVLKHADAAMYSAKAQGKNRLQRFTPEMDRLRQRRIMLDMSLNGAGDRNELVLQYQPRVILKTGQLSSVEALVRWEHPEYGTMSPNEFIPFAEETGQIVKLGEWVLREACRQNKQWQTMGLPKVRVAVNVSGRQFWQQDFAFLVADALEKANLEPRWLELELTENVLMHRVDATSVTLERLRALGVTISVDDFGTGFSSLSYLTRFAVDCLKIDQSFVRNVVQSRSDAAIVRAIMTMSDSLGIGVIAEGVETYEQLEALSSMGCIEAQGYLFHKPLSVLQLQSLLNDGVEKPGRDQIARRYEIFKSDGFQVGVQP